MKIKSQKIPMIINAVMVTAALMFSGCAKDGATGPAGPKGDPGPAGAANVQKVDLVFLPNEWTNATAQSFATKLVPEITADIINNGVVLLYARDGNTLSQLPVTFTDESEIVLSFYYDVEPGKIIVTVAYNADATLPGTVFAPSLDFRLVLISGSSAAVQKKKEELLSATKVIAD